MIQALRRKCSSVVLDTGIHLSGSEKTQAPSAAPTGPPDAFALSETGRHHGFNAFAVVGLQSLGARMEQRGILWFKGDRHLLQAHADAEVYDTLTGSKALSRDFYFETQVDEATYQQIQTGKGAQLPQIRSALLKIAEEMAGAICEAVDALSWRGFIVSVNEDVVFLSSGKRTGLKDHTVLTVFDQGQIVQGTGGQRFILPGKSKGRIQVVALQPNACEAKVLSGGPFVKGDFVEVE